MQDEFVASVRAQSFHTPSYTETGLIPNGFVLKFNGRGPTDSNVVLALRGRVAWAHDWVSDPTLTPMFQSLPGASFIVNGALPVKDSALASAGAQRRPPHARPLSPAL